MLREKDRIIRKAMMIFDAFIVSLAFLVSFFLRKNFHNFYNMNIFPAVEVVQRDPMLSLNDYLVVLFFVVPIWCLALRWAGMYRSLRTKKTYEAVFAIVKAALLTGLVFGALTFIFKIGFVSRAFLAIFLSVSSLFLAAEKTVIFYVTHYIRTQGYNYRKLLMVGTGNRAALFINKVKRHPEWGLRIRGIIDYEAVDEGREVEGVKVIGTLKDLPDILHNQPIDEVIFIVPRSKLGAMESSLLICETEGVKATIAVDLFELKIARARQTDIEGLPLLTFESTAAEGWALFIKRAFDMIASGAGLILLSPLFLAVALIIKITSPGEVLYKQKRVGLNGRSFTLYKFRSMYKGSHERLAELMERNEMKGPVFKIRNDPRATPFGKFLRKTSMDEIPQLFNVFMGQMSIVGPRPPIAEEVAKYEPWQRRRLSMRPGITCLWQISGRNGIGFDEWMNLDLEYISHWSLWLDLKILMRTVPVVIFGIGAY